MRFGSLSFVVIVTLDESKFRDVPPGFTIVFEKSTMSKVGILLLPVSFSEAVITILEVSPA